MVVLGGTGRAGCDDRRVLLHAPSTTGCSTSRDRRRSRTSPPSSGSPLRAALPPRRALHRCVVYFVPAADEPAGALRQLVAAAVARGGVSLSIAWERRGGVARRRPDARARLRAVGLGARRRPLAESFDTVLLDNRGIGRATPARSVHGRGAGRRRRRCSTRPVSSAPTWSGRASAGWSRRSSRSAPERVERLVLVCTTPGGANAALPCPADRAADGRGADARAPRRTAAVRRERAGARPPRGDGRADPRAPDRDGAAALGWAAQAAAGRAFDAWDRLPDRSRADARRPRHGGRRRRPAECAAPRGADPDARVELFEGCGHLLFWEQPDRFVGVVGGSSVSGCTPSGAGSRIARATRRTGSRSTSRGES